MKKQAKEVLQEQKTYRDNLKAFESQQQELANQSVQRDNVIMADLQKTNTALHTANADIINLKILNKQIHTQLQNTKEQNNYFKNDLKNLQDNLSILVQRISQSDNKQLSIQQEVQSSLTKFNQLQADIQNNVAENVEQRLKEIQSTVALTSNQLVSQSSFTNFFEQVNLWVQQTNNSINQAQSQISQLEVLGNELKQQEQEARLKMQGVIVQQHHDIKELERLGNDIQDSDQQNTSQIKALIAKYDKAIASNKQAQEKQEQQIVQLVDETLGILTELTEFKEMLAINSQKALDQEQFVQDVTDKIERIQAQIDNIGPGKRFKRERIDFYPQQTNQHEQEIAINEEESKIATNNKFQRFANKTEIGGRGRKQEQNDVFIYSLLFMSTIAVGASAYKYFKHRSTSSDNKHNK